MVSGAAKGLGLAAAQKLTAEGAKVVLADVDEAGAMAAAKKLPGAVGVYLDVTDPEAVDRLMRDVAKELGAGRLDIVVNNAGVVGPIVPLHKYPLDEYNRVMQVNLNGAFYVLRAALGQMKRQDPAGGVVINTCSTAALTGIVRCPLSTHGYHKSKL